MKTIKEEDPLAALQPEGQVIVFYGFFAFSKR